MGLATQQLVIVLLLLALGAYFLAAAIRPTARYLRYAYWTWLRILLRVLLRKPQPTLYERASAAIFGLMMLAGAAFVASFHLS